MKKTDKIMKWYYILMGVGFGLICACMFCGLYGKIASGIILITWTLNGFLWGIKYEKNKRRDEINELLSIVERQHEMIEWLSKNNKDKIEKEEKTIE